MLVDPWLYIMQNNSGINKYVLIGIVAIGIATFVIEYIYENKFFSTAFMPSRINQKEYRMNVPKERRRIQKNIKRVISSKKGSTYQVKATSLSSSQERVKKEDSISKFHLEDELFLGVAINPDKKSKQKIISAHLLDGVLELRNGELFIKDVILFKDKENETDAFSIEEGVRLGPHGEFQYDHDEYGIISGLVSIYNNSVKVRFTSGPFKGSFLNFVSSIKREELLAKRSAPFSAKNSLPEQARDANERLNTYPEKSLYQPTKEELETMKARESYSF